MFVMQTGTPRGEETGDRQGGEEEEEPEGEVEARKQTVMRRTRRMKLPKDAEGHRTRDQRRNEVAKMRMMRVRKRLPKTREEAQPTRGKEARAEEEMMKTARLRKEIKGRKEERKEEKRKKTTRARKETREKMRRTRKRRRMTGMMITQPESVREKNFLVTQKMQRLKKFGN